jgi:hypothetical protein
VGITQQRVEGAIHHRYAGSAVALVVGIAGTAETSGNIVALSVDVAIVGAGYEEIYTKQIGAQLNMTSQSWDGKRMYFTSSLLANWDKTEGPQGDVQYFKAYTWKDGALHQEFAIDFLAEKLGAPHQMRFGARALYARSRPLDDDVEAAATDR